MLSKIIQMLSKGFLTVVKVENFNFVWNDLCISLTYSGPSLYWQCNHKPKNTVTTTEEFFFELVLLHGLKQHQFYA